MFFQPAEIGGIRREIGGIRREIGGIWREIGGIWRPDNIFHKCRKHIHAFDLFGCSTVALSLVT